MESVNKEESNKSSGLSKLGLIITGITGGAAVIISVVCLPFVTPALRRVCLPYVPATTTQVDNVLRALKGRSGRVVDLGSGDGRIVLATANQGLLSTGVELNPWLVYYSRLNAIYKGLSPKTRFIRTDLWKFSLKPFQNVIIFGVEEMMAELELKMMKELDRNSCIVVCRFPLPNKEPIRTIGEGIDTVWVYQS